MRLFIFPWEGQVARESIKVCGQQVREAADTSKSTLLASGVLGHPKRQGKAGKSLPERETGLLSGSQGRPEPSSEMTASTKMAFVKMGRGEETDDCPRAAFPFLGFSASLSNSGAGDSVSVSCGRGGLTPSGGRIWPKLFGFAALRSRELSPGGGTHLSFHSSILGPRWPGVVTPVLWGGSQKQLEEEPM